jgi:hypothetical protein
MSEGRFYRKDGGGLGREIGGGHQSRKESGSQIACHAII